MGQRDRETERQRDRETEWRVTQRAQPTPYLRAISDGGQARPSGRTYTRIARWRTQKKRDREIGAARYDSRQFCLWLWRTLAAGSSAGGHASILPVALEDIGGRELVCGRAWNKSAGVPRKKRVRHKESSGYRWMDVVLLHPK